MHSRIVEYLKITAHSRWYWLASIVCGLTLLGYALLSQHVFDEQPCLMCIQARLLISLYVIVAFAGLFCSDKSVLNSIAHLSVVIIAIGLIERSYQLLGTELGFVFSDCGFELGLPAWFAIENWLPWIYRVETTCGYTPEIIFGITIAEALMLFSVCLFLLTLCVAVASLLNNSD